MIPHQYTCPRVTEILPGEPPRTTRPVPQGTSPLKQRNAVMQAPLRAAGRQHPREWHR